jgi:hypothetical protein
MRGAWLGSIFLLVVGVLGCNTPTIPIPPLHAPDFSSPASGQWVARGAGDGLAPEGSEVFIIDRATGAGVAARADATGGYTTPPFPGMTGDTVELLYREPTGELSPSICVTLAAGTPTAFDCP